MGLEAATYISQLVPTNPAGGDPASSSDDHHRLVKAVLVNTLANFAGPVTATHVEVNYLAGVTSLIQGQINGKSPSANPTFTGTVVLPATTSIGPVSGTELGYLDGVTSAVQTQLNSKAPSVAPTFAGAVVLPSTTSIGSVDATELGYLDGVTSSIQSQFTAQTTAVGLKAPLASPALTGTPTAPTAATGNNSTQIATTAFVAATSLAAALPGQSGNAGKYIQTDGTTATWQYPKLLMQLHPSSAALVLNRLNVLTGAGPLAMTVPTPAAGDVLQISVSSNTIGHTIDWGAQKVGGVAPGVMTTDDPQLRTGQLQYDATNGWN